MSIRVTVDTGGTFSDFVIFDEATGRYRILKIPSTPDDPGRAVLDGLDRLAAEGSSPDSISFFSHGTTVATNALIEEKGARIGLAITEGFRGIYETMELSRPFGRALFDLHYQKPRLLAPESRTAEIRERVGAHGEVVVALDEGSIEDAIALFEAEEVESVGICFLFSFMNPEHERLVRESIKAKHPDWWISSSSDLLPRIREYYRLSTTAINAYVSPILGRYIRRLDGELDARGVAPDRRFTMQSNGGSAPFFTVAEHAITTILSGPAGGVTAGAAMAAAAGLQNIITFDMGGTSCDVALMRGGEPVVSDRSKIGGRDIAVPMLDINTVSAGGGTLAQVDEQGQLHVGPHSAGAVPGPAGYGRGGDRPTITDADLVLGYLNPVAILGGQLAVDMDGARRVIQRDVADPLGVDLLRAADGMVKIVNVTMAEAIKSISTQRGFDLRDFTLVPFGGAGPVHACQIAVDLGIPTVLVPMAPGAFSALGLLMSNVKHDYLQSRLSPLDELQVDDVNKRFTEMRETARAQLKNERFIDREIQFRMFLDMRYAGQGYENPVPIESFPLEQNDLPKLRARFDEVHRRDHGHAAPTQPVEVVNYRVEGIGLVPQVELARVEAASSPVESARIAERPVLFTVLGTEPVITPVYDRALLRAGHSFDGPAIVEQYDATTVICPEQMVSVDEFGNLLVRMK
ncbi:MAG: hydantoinase/oxoprolinase family protein [Chloroflexota bacterium]